jgi:hypothetical protein
MVLTSCWRKPVNRLTPSTACPPSSPEAITLPSNSFFGRARALAKEDVGVTSLNILTMSKWKKIQLKKKEITRGCGEGGNTET